MSMKLFAVRDVKAECFGAPMAIATRGLAVRSFVDAVCNPQSELRKYPTDFMLYEIGEWDANSGAVAAHALPQFVMSATEALEVARKERERVEAERAKMEPELALEGAAQEVA